MFDPRYVHGHTAVFDLSFSSALEDFNISVAGVSDGIPKPNWCLHSKFFFESSQRGICVQRPITPSGACQTILLRKKACLIQETHIFMSDILRPFHVRYDYITLYEKNKRITYDKLRSTLLDSWCNQHKYTWIVHIAAPCTMDLFDNLNVRNNPIQTRAQLFAWSPKSSSWKNIPMIAIIASNAATASCFNIGWGDQQKVTVWT